MKLYTIGFTKKSAKQFFDILEQNNVKQVLDIRLNNSSQLAGFAKGKDLEYFLEKIQGIRYKHDLKLSPTKEILNGYKKGTIQWEEYESEFIKLLNDRNIQQHIQLNYIKDLDSLCLLCSEHIADNCHRRLVAEFIKSNFEDIEIIHL